MRIKKELKFKAIVLFQQSKNICNEVNEAERKISIHRGVRSWINCLASRSSWSRISVSKAPDNHEDLFSISDSASSNGSRTDMSCVMSVHNFHS